MSKKVFNFLFGNKNTCNYRTSFSLLRLSGDQLAKFHSRVQNTNYICSSISQYLHYPFVIIVLCPGGSVEVLFKEEDKGVVVFLKEGEGKCAAADVAVAVAVVALDRAVAVAMCARVM